MGCLSVNVSQVLPTVAASTLSTNSKIDADATVTNNIDTIVSRGWNSADITATNNNTDMASQAWLVCKIGISGIYLAVNEGLIITLENAYLKVTRG
jgi:hypothetical protein